MRLSPLVLWIAVAVASGSRKGYYASQGGGPEKKPRLSIEPVNIIEPVKVFVVGGHAGADLYSNVVESLSLRGGHEFGSWRSEPRMPLMVAGCGAVSLGGHLYVLGGHDARLNENDRELGRKYEADDVGEDGITFEDFVFPTLDRMHRYDPRSGAWTSQPDMLRRRTAFLATGMCGRIYAVGGFNGRTFVPEVESFDPREGRWRRESDMLNLRSSLAGVGLGSDLYVIGGFDGQGTSSAVDILDVRASAWREGPPLLSARSGAAAAVLNGNLHVFGGIGDTDYLAGMEVLHLSSSPTATWERDVADSMRRARTGLAAVTLDASATPSGRSCILAMGGFDGEDWLDCVEMYDPDQGWTDLHPLPSSRSHLAAAIL